MAYNNQGRAYNGGGSQRNFSAQRGMDSRKAMERPILRELGDYEKTPYASTGRYDIRFIVEFARKVSDMLTGRGYLVGKDENKTSQIRKYFEFARRVESALKANQMDYDTAVLELNSLRYQVSYARERGKVSDCFVDFIEINLDKIHNTADLYFFIKHFEAVVGYSKERK